MRTHQLTFAPALTLQWAIPPSRVYSVFCESAFTAMVRHAAGADGSRPDGVLFEASCWAEVDAFLFGPPTASGQTRPHRGSQVMTAVLSTDTPVCDIALHVLRMACIIMCGARPCWSCLPCQGTSFRGGDGPGCNDV